MAKYRIKSFILNEGEEWVYVPQISYCHGLWTDWKDLKEYSFHFNYKNQLIENEKFMFSTREEALTVIEKHKATKRKADKDYKVYKKSITIEEI